MQSTTTTLTFNSLNNTFNDMEHNITKAKKVMNVSFREYVASFIQDSKEIKEIYNFTSLKNAKAYLLKTLENDAPNKKALEIFKIIFNLELKKIVIKKELITLEVFTGANATEAKISANVLSFSDIVVLSRLITPSQIKTVNEMMELEDEYVASILDFIDSLKTTKSTTKKVVDKTQL